MGYLIDRVEWTEGEGGQPQRVYHFSEEAMTFFQKLRAKKTAELLDERGYEPEEIEKTVEEMKREGKSEEEIEERLDSMARGRMGI